MALPVMVKAALPMVPGINQIPGIKKSGGDFADITRERTGAVINAAQVAAYAEVCGFEPKDDAPLTYPHMLAFPLHMEIMTSREFPYPAIGTVHLRNTIHQLRPVHPGESLDIAVSATNLRSHPKGKVFDMVAGASIDGETVWESTSTYLRLGRSEAAAAVLDSEPFEVVAGNGITWRLAGNLGRRYGAVSGDMNPIHLFPLTAKALGFKRQITHGMWTTARCVAAIANRLGDEATVEVEFKKPIFLPGIVAFGSRVVDGAGGKGIDFSVTNPKSGAPHLVGRAR
jgi:acyl dehydratase